MMVKISQNNRRPFALPLYCVGSSCVEPWMSAQDNNVRKRTQKDAWTLQQTKQGEAQGSDTLGNPLLQVTSFLGKHLAQYCLQKRYKGQTEKRFQAGSLNLIASLRHSASEMMNLICPQCCTQCPNLYQQQRVSLTFVATSD